MVFLTQLFTWSFIVTMSGRSLANKTAHCWSNPHCNGSISQSFLRESDCCVYGGMSYIKCSKKQLKAILMNVRTQHCVLCPPKRTTTTVKPNAKCTPSTCPKPNERCVELVNTKTTYCVKCKRLNCDKFRGSVCGSDKKTYKDECTLLCRSSPNTHVAYQGHCKANPKCNTIKCRKGFKCLTKKGASPRCYAMKIVCGSNNVTYASIKDLNRDICRKRKFINISHFGHCKHSAKPKAVRIKGKPCTILSPFVIIGK